MPAIGEMAYGYDTQEVFNYFDAIRREALNEVRSALDDIGGIVSTCESEWEGQARDNFVANLQKDVQRITGDGGIIDNLDQALVNEIRSLNNAMAEKDTQLIQAE